MTDTPEDFPRNLEEMLRHLMQAAQRGDAGPIFIGMKIVVPPGGGLPDSPGNLRGDATEPAVEVHRVGDRVVIVTELPGISPEQVHLLFRDDRIFVWARDLERHYRGSARIPPARKGSEEISFRHGLLEVSYIPEDEGDRGKGAGSE